MRKVRRVDHLSQDDLAKRLEVRQDMISDYECGRGRPSLNMIWRIGRKLRVSVGYFFPDEVCIPLSSDERETLILLKSFSPMALKYTLTFRPRLRISKNSSGCLKSCRMKRTNRACAFSWSRI